MASYETRYPPEHEYDRETEGPADSTDWCELRHPEPQRGGYHRPPAQASQVIARPFCTRPKHHRGDHMMHNWTASYIITRWPNKQERARWELVEPDSE